MSWPTTDNPHTERFPAYELVWWKGNTASGKAGADRVELVQHVDGIGQARIMSFKVPDQIAELERWETALGRAFARGRTDKAREVKQVLEL